MKNEKLPFLLLSEQAKASVETSRAATPATFRAATTKASATG